MVRDVFRLAKENAPAIIFIDEIDAIATKRFDAQTGADREVQRILLELLNQMDGFDQNVNVKVMLIGIYPIFLSRFDKHHFVKFKRLLESRNARCVFGCILTEGACVALHINKILFCYFNAPFLRAIVEIR